MSIYSRLDRIAADVEKLNRQVKSVSNAPQSQRTSVEGGSIDFNDADGNLQAIVGGQDDGSTTVRHVDGPVPPIPSGLTAHVDGPIIQVTWDGTFEDAAGATLDWSHLEVVAVGPNSEQLRGTISDVTGASTSLAATVSGEWTVVARSVSRAGKHSLDGDAGAVTVELVDVAGAIEAVQDSANGKNKVTYSSHAPTSDDPGIFDDTWFVGQVGRPNDIVEATNLALNPRYQNGIAGNLGPDTQVAGGGGQLSVEDGWVKLTPTTGNGSTVYGVDSRAFAPDPWRGKTYTVSVTLRLDTALAGSLHAEARTINFNYLDANNNYQYYVARSEKAPNVAGEYRLSVTGTVPVDARAWFVRFAGGSSSTSTFWTDVQVEEGETATAFFDGDTESGETVNESHYRWTGTPHASTSEKYLPALTIGDSDSWNITEQYRHDGSGWVKVELSHKVFSSVDLGKATVGELDGIRIMGQTVRGQQLSGDAIDGKVITGGTYRTTGGTGSWSDAGLFIAQPDGTSMVRFPTDGSPLSLTASDVQIDRASITDLDLSYGAVRSGGELTLASGVTAPPSPPELTTGWDKLCTLPKPSERSDYANLAYWSNGNQWVRAINVLGTGEGDRIEIYDYSTGALARSFPVTIDARHGVTVMGDTVYIFGKDHGIADPRLFIFGYDLNTGARTSRHEYTRAIQAKNALGNDGTNLIIASVYNRELWVHRRNPTTGVQVGSDMRSGFNSWPSGGRDLFGVRISGNDVEVVTSLGGRVYLNSNNALVRKTDSANASGYAGWVLPANEAAGMVMKAGRFGAIVPFVVDGTGAVYEGAQFSSDTNVSSCFTWFDGTNETTPSPELSGFFSARESPAFSMPTRAGLQKRLYFKFGTGDWARVTLPETLTVLSWMDAPNYTPVLAAPPTVNSFPNADPATLKSTNDKFEIKGDGSGTWGPLTFNADGTMTSTQIPAWVPVTTFKTGFGPQTWGYAPAYRIWPDGKVEWRGTVAGTIGAGQTPLFTIPSAARPTQPTQFPAATSYSSNSQGSTARMEFGKAGQLDVASAYEGSEARTWISMDGVYYYKD